MRTTRGSTLGIAALALVAASAIGTTAQSPGTPSASPPVAPAPPVTRGPGRAIWVEQLFAPDATPEVFATGLAFPEGLLWLPDGRLIVSELQGNVVSVFDGDGTRGDFRRPSHNANGHARDLDGSVLQAEHGDATTPGRITRLSTTGADTVLADSFGGKHFNSPNDLAVKSDGSIWFTDPTYGLQGPSETGITGVYRLDPTTGDVTLVTDAVDQPNGIAFSPDEATLYVSDGTDIVNAFPVNDDGTIGPGEPFARGCDGIAVDERGNVWSTPCDVAVHVTDPWGIEVGVVPFGDGFTANLASGGDDGTTLFATETGDGGAIFSLELVVRESP